MCCWLNLEGLNMTGSLELATWLFALLKFKTRRVQEIMFVA